MRKYLATIIFLVFCSASQSSEKTDKALRIVYSTDKLDKILPEFALSAGMPVKIEFLDQNDLKLRMMELNWTPDAVILPADHLGLHGFVKYSEVDPQLFKAKISDRIWSSGISDGKLYGAPVLQGNHLMLYYNKSLVKEPAPDWQSMVAQKAELDAKGIATIAWIYDAPFAFLPILGGFGGWPMNNGEIDLNTPAMIAALDFYESPLVKQLTDRNCKNECPSESFKSGKVAYTIDGEWMGKIFFNALGDKLGVSAIPMTQGKKMVPPFSTYVIAFPNNSLSSEKRSILIKLVDHLQSPKIQQQMWEQAGGIPVEASAFKFAQKTAQGYLKVTLELMADTKPVPADQAMTFIWDAMTKGFKRYQAGALDSKSTALYMQQLAEHNIRNAQQEIATKPNVH